MSPSYPGTILMSLSKLKQQFKRDAVQIKMETDMAKSARASPEFWICLPNNCVESDVILYVEKDTSNDDYFRYYLRFDRQIKYKGKNQNLTYLCSGMQIGFDTWEHLLQYIAALPNDNSHRDMQVADIVMEIGSKAPVTEVIPFDEEAVMLPETISRTPTADQIAAELKKQIFGQDHAVEVIAYQVATFLARKVKSRVCSIVIWGEPGTGKTKAAEILGKILKRLCSPAYDTTVIQMNTLTENISVSSLTGARPNYVGYDQKALLEVVEDNPHHIFILDETEKAHPEVIKVFMSILDEGRLASRKELSDGSHELDFRDCIFIFTSNLKLGGSVGSRIGFRIDDKIEEVDCSEDGVDVKYVPEPDRITFVQQMYQDTEKARAAFVRTGVLKEIASRFDCFVEFKPLGNKAKLRILAKTVLDTAYEYGIRITRIETGIMQELINASTREKALTVRSFRVVVNGYLAPAFMAVAGESEADVADYKLDGTLADPQLIPV